jgi:ADP-heptose:LPS heptosyltransferase
MVWTPETSQGYEAQKCRYRIASFLRGRGLDLGCGDEKVSPGAIGIDCSGKAANLQLDLSQDHALGLFSDGVFDYIFSSHCLEDFRATDAILAEWWRVIRPDGHLILYGPDPDYYPHVGTAGANPHHQHDLYWQDVWKILDSFGNARLISATRHHESNEYSWQLIARKREGFLKRLRAAPLVKHLQFGSNNGYMSFPRKKKTDKECLIIRYGAFGDAIWVTPVLKMLKKQGYYIVYNCTSYSAEVLRENPHIDEFMIQERDVVPNAELEQYWEEIGRGFEKVINFSGSVEGELLILQGSADYDLPHKERHKRCNVNYIDRTMERAGLPDAKGVRPELHFTQTEETLAQMLREKHKDKFLVIWSLSGSSLHKVYPYTHKVAMKIHQLYPDVVIFTVGDDFCKMLESWQNPNTLNRSGIWTIRQSMIMTKHADLVIGSETGVLNAASCFDTPKIVFLSHSSPENLTKYWTNCTPLSANVHCQPCHRLIYDDECFKTTADVRALDGQILPLKVNTDGARCMERLKPKQILEAFDKVHRAWQNKKRKGDKQ